MSFPCMVCSVVAALVQATRDVLRAPLARRLLSYLARLLSLSTTFLAWYHAFSLTFRSYLFRLGFVPI